MISRRQLTVSARSSDLRLFRGSGRTASIWH
jgi:hypothetical protein